MKGIGVVLGVLFISLMLLTGCQSMFETTIPLKSSDISVSLNAVTLNVVKQTIELSWTASVPTAVVKYKIMVGTTDPTKAPPQDLATWTFGTLVTPSVLTDIPVSSLSDGTTYYAQVVTYDKGGNASKASNPLKFVYKGIVSEISRFGQFSGLGGLSIDRSGLVWTTADGLIVRYDPANPTATLTTFGPTEQLYPFEVLADNNGKVWVTDANARIFRFDPADFSGTLTQIDLGISGLQPVCMALDSSGKIWLSDFGGRIIQFDPANVSASVTLFGTSGTGSGQFQSPFGLAIDSQGLVWVAEPGSFWGGDDSSLISFDPTDFSGTFKRYSALLPFRIACDNEGKIWISSLIGRLMRFDPENPDTLTTISLEGVAYGLAIKGTTLSLTNNTKIKTFQINTSGTVIATAP